MKPVICNNTPLVALWQLKRLFLFRDLYTELWIPEEVRQEFLGTERMVRQQALNNAPWIKTVRLADSQSRSTYVREGFNLGEAAVFALAKEHDTQFIIIDELKARRYAERIRLPFKGTIGVLLEAKKRGLIGPIKPLLLELQKYGIYMGKPLIEEALEQAGET